MDYWGKGSDTGIPKEWKSGKEDPLRKKPLKRGRPLAINIFYEREILT